MKTNTYLETILKKKTTRRIDITNCSLSEKEKLIVLLDTIRDKEKETVSQRRSSDTMECFGIYYYQFIN